MRYLSLCLLCLWALAGCAGIRGGTTPGVTATPPVAVPITANDAASIAVQPGPLWVLLSGVDEHGLIAEHELSLLTAPDPTAAQGARVHTGVAASVQEIRHTGPQNLQRFYHVQTVTGATGWISDYYVRRVAYLFDSNSNTIPLYSAADGQGREVEQLANVSPVAIKVPTDDEWWLVQAVQTGTLGWVRASFVKESPVWEFLLNQQHDH